MATSLPKPMTETAHVAAARLSLEKAWKKRRPWSRTDTERFLNERSEPLLALLRRQRGETPKHTHHVGHWMREHRPASFDRAHATLAASATDAIRERIIPSDLV